jgi:hypothetical protein
MCQRFTQKLHRLRHIVLRQGEAVMSTSPETPRERSATPRAGKLGRLAQIIVLKPLDYAGQALGKVGGTSLLLLIIVGLLFVWMWQNKEWQSYIGAATGGLGAMLGASAGLFREGNKARWIMAIAGGIFTAWVTWYTVSDLSQELREKTEITEQLSKRLDTAKQDSAYYLKLIPTNDLSRVLTEAGWKIRDRFLLAIAKRPFIRRDFDTTEDGLELIESIDGDNGHVHYFRGLMDRMRGDPGKGRQNFYAYLAKEERSQPSTRTGEVGALPCRTPEGFCRERTAWVFHLLANDFYAEAMARKKAGLPLEAYHTYLSEALDHACTAVKLFSPNGFTDPSQLTPTRDLVKLLSAELGRGC